MEDKYIYLISTYGRLGKFRRFILKILKINLINK